MYLYIISTVFELIIILFTVQIIAQQVTPKEKSSVTQADIFEKQTLNSLDRVFLFKNSNEYFALHCAGL